MTTVLPWILVVAVLAFSLARGRARRRHSGPRRSALPAFLHGETGLIAAREVRQRVRGRVFRAVTVLLLLAVAAAIVIPVLTEGRASESRVGLVPPISGSERSAVAAAVSRSGIQARFVPEPTADAARRQLLARRLDLAVLGLEEVVTRTSTGPSDTSTTATLARVVASTLGDLRAVRAAGLTTQQTAVLAGARPVPITSLRPSASRRTVPGAAVAGLILLFVMLSQYLSWTLMGVMEEKSSRVVEVLLATVRPLQLLAGKLLGIGLLVFAQAGLVVGFALALAAATGSGLLRGTAPAVVASNLLWLVLGYAFYSWVYAAAGSMAERQDQVQALVLPLSIPMIVGYVAAIAVASSGTPSTFFEVLAYLPPTAPFAMPILVALGDATWWQFALSALISVVCTAGVARMAAHVYRRAVLRTGRRVRFREVFSHG